MITRIHHIGIAVPDIDDASRRYPDTLGIDAGGREDVQAARTTVEFFKIGDTRIELIAPMGDDSPVGKHLQRRGPGMHHICLEVDDLDAEVERLRAAGMRFVTEDIQRGAHDSRIIFLHPKSTGGVLIELQQAR